MSIEAPCLRGANGDLLTTEGVIAFVVLSEGSHAERSGPVLVRSPGEADVQLYLVGDNPFENKGLRAYDGERVRVAGAWRNGVLRVEPAALGRVNAPKGDALRGTSPGVADGQGPPVTSVVDLVSPGAEGGPAPLPQRLPPEGASASVENGPAPIEADP